jgi:hypothetical protein
MYNILVQKNQNNKSKFHDSQIKSVEFNIRKWIQMKKYIDSLRFDPSLLHLIHCFVGDYITTFTAHLSNIKLIGV